jgi:AcrR family transcriptional regulator
MFFLASRLPGDADTRATVTGGTYPVVIDEITADEVIAVTTEGPASPPLPGRRRPSYPVSPVIGPEGNRAAQEMMDAARRLFAERGYHGTSVTAICAATERSDAAFYQYFSSKRELFKMFYEELGKELLAHFEQLQTLTGDAAGLARLGQWLRGLSELLRRYSTVFMEWPAPDEGEPGAENPQERYMVRFADALSSRLGAADTGGLSSRTLAISVICLTAWSHLVLDAQSAAGGGAAVSPATLDEALTGMVHRAIFPPSRVPGGDGVLLKGTVHRDGDADQSDGTGRGPGAPPGLRRAATTPAGRRTIERITSAAAVAFDQHGLAGTSVNSIIAEAGVAHGTFYQYWTDRAAVIATLAYQAASAVRDRLGALPLVGTEAELTEWLDGWLDVIARHGVSLHVWTSEAAGDAGPRSMDAEIRPYLERDLERATSELLGRAGRPCDLPSGANAIVLWTILMEFPYTTWRHRPIFTRHEVLRAQMFLLVRGVLA